MPAELIMRDQNGSVHVKGRRITGHNEKENLKMIETGKVSKQMGNEQCKISIRKLYGAELTDVLPLIWEVFLQYEAPQYTESGKQAFWDAIHDKGYLKQLCAYGAFNEDAPVGIIATRSNGHHLALFFVKGTYHGKGIGRALGNRVLSESTAEMITVYSSNYAVSIYEKLGFVKTDEMQTEGGIAYVPMEYHFEISNSKKHREILFEKQK